MARNGGRLLCLSDVLRLFLASFNMYSKTTKAGESKEYQDLLSLYNGRSKRRETGKSHN